MCFVRSLVAVCSLYRLNSERLQKMPLLRRCLEKATKGRARTESSQSFIPLRCNTRGRRCHLCQQPSDDKIIRVQMVAASGKQEGAETQGYCCLYKLLWIAPSSLMCMYLFLIFIHYASTVSLGEAGECCWVKAAPLGSPCSKTSRGDVVSRITVRIRFITGDLLQ